MKKRIIVGLIVVPLLATATWFLWPELRLLTIRFPENITDIKKEFGVSVFEWAGSGGGSTNTFSSFRLGARRILWLEHDSEGSEVIRSADILYHFKETVEERLSNRLVSVWPPVAEARETAEQNPVHDLETTDAEIRLCGFCSPPQPIGVILVDNRSQPPQIYMLGEGDVTNGITVVTIDETKREVMLKVDGQFRIVK